MPPPCTVCSSPSRPDIDRALVAGAVLRSVAQQHGLTVWSVKRHRDAHLPAALCQAQEAAELAEADSLLRQVKGLQAKTLQTLLDAEKKGDHRTVLMAVREARGNLELLAKLLGELQQEGTINLVVAPEWVRLRGVIVLALAQYPDAQAALVAALEEEG